MKISAKTRYGISAMIYLARNYSVAECVTIISLSGKLNISKIYLEQVFSLLKRAGLVISTKGAQGGYNLSVHPNEITVYNIFAAIETSFIEKAKETVSESDKSIESAMQTVIFDKLDEAVNSVLSGITLNDLVSEAEKHASADGYMYYL